MKYISEGEGCENLQLLRNTDSIKSSLCPSVCVLRILEWGSRTDEDCVKHFLVFVESKQF